MSAKKDNISTAGRTPQTKAGRAWAIIAAILATLATAGCFWASLSAPATLLLFKVGIDPFTTAEELAAVIVGCAVLAASPTLRAMISKILQRALSASFRVASLLSFG